MQSVYLNVLFLTTQGIASKKGDLKTLGKKVVPMEDLFQKFRSWLKETGSQLASLSPPSTENPGRSRQMQQAKVYETY